MKLIYGVKLFHVIESETGQPTRVSILGASVFGVGGAAVEPDHMVAIPYSHGIISLIMMGCSVSEYDSPFVGKGDFHQLTPPDCEVTFSIIAFSVVGKQTNRGCVYKEIFLPVDLNGDVEGERVKVGKDFSAQLLSDALQISVGDLAAISVPS